MRTSTTTLFTFIVLLSYANVQRPKADRKTNPPNETKKRNTDHIDEILLRPDPIGYDDNDPNIKAVLKELRTIYQNMIRPMEKQFRYADLRRHTMSDVDIYAKPIILLVGPWSTGKSTMINYLLGIEGTLESLYVGAEPTTGDFTVLSYGDEYRTVEGVVLATDATKPFASMEKFGQIFLEHLLGVEMNRPLLRNVSFIDTPGILENRRQQERGYPYNDVMRWLVHRSDLIFVVFDPTKLDVGYELETLFKQLKGKESVLRIILNKADSMSEQDLMRVYGALFWSLSPLINVTEPPRVYVGSFWEKPFHDDDLAEVLLREEKSLLHDMREVIRNRVYNKIAFVRQYAIRVRIHALLVDSYVTAYRRNKGLFGGSDELARQIVEDPESYDVFKTVLSHPNVSKYDLPEPEEYEDFFRINPLPDQRRISEHCGYFSGCAIDQLNRAISTDLPILLRRFRTPNERRGQKRSFGEPPGDFAAWHRENELKRKAAAAAAAQQEAEDEVPETPVQQAPATRGAKKYRKSPPAPPPTSGEEEEVVPQQEVKRRGRPAKAKEAKAPEVRSSKLSGKSKEKQSEEAPAAEGGAKEPTRRKRRSKDKTEPVAREPEPPTPEPEPETPPPPEKPEPQVEVPEEIPSSEPESVEVEVEVVEEPQASPPAPPPPAPKASRKASKRSDETPPTPVSPKFQASAEVSKKAPKRVKEEKVSEEKTREDESEDQEDQDDQEESQSIPSHKASTKSPEPPHKGSAKKPSETEKKKLAPKSSPRPSPPPSTAPPVKCNKFRKSCQEGDQVVETVSKQVHRKAPEVSEPASPAPAASGAKCNKYRKSCNTGDSEEAPSKSVEKPKAVVTESHKVHAAPAPEVKKCNKYRKSCQESGDGEDEPVKKTVSKEAAHEDHKKAHKEVHTAKHSHAPSAPTKCNKYRKSCQEAMAAAGELDSGDQQRTKQEDKPEPVVVIQKIKCGKYSYRKSCYEERDDDDDDEAEEKPRSEKKAEPKVPEIKVVAAPSYPAPSGKCNKYRKSCQQAEDDDDSPAASKAPESKAKPAKAPESHAPTPVVGSGGKCNKFRKSCQAAMEESSESPAVSAPKVAEKHKPVASSAPVTPTPGGPCNKYRKSCRDSESSGSAEAQAKVAAKVKPASATDEAKPKKLCKKNATASTNAAGKKEQQKKGAKAAPSPAPVQQNKWRKPKTPPAEQLISS